MTGCGKCFLIGQLRVFDMNRKRKMKVGRRSDGVPQQAGTEQGTPHREMWGGYAGAWQLGSSGFFYWPTLDSRQEVNSWTLDRLWRAARSLEANSGLAGKAVSDEVELLGWLVPHACTADQDWNHEADRLFMARGVNPELFDARGELNFFTAQIWTERQRAIDGDVLTVLTSGPDEGGAFAFYEAPQVQSPAEGGGGWNCGVRVNQWGRAVAYGLADRERGKVTVVQARDAILYRHNGGGGKPRGVSDLHRAIRHLHDEAEIVGYVKQSAKLAATIGLVETADAEKRPGMGGTAGKVEVGPDGRKVERILGGPTIHRLEPGRDLKVLSDNRPSPNVMALLKYLMDEVAYGIGLSPALLWEPDKLGSGGIRFVMQKLKRWLKIRHAYRQMWCVKVWRYTLAREMALGRLRMCKDPYWVKCLWTPMSDMTIDLGREGNLMINLVDSALADQDAWCLANYGCTFEEIVNNKIRNLKIAKEACEKNGLTLQEVMPGANRGGVAAAPDAPADDEQGSGGRQEEGSFHPHE